MATVRIEEKNLEDIAQAIVNKTHKRKCFLPSEMANEINALTSLAEIPDGDKKQWPMNTTQYSIAGQLQCYYNSWIKKTPDEVMFSDTQAPLNITIYQGEKALNTVSFKDNELGGTRGQLRTVSYSVSVLSPGIYSLVFSKATHVTCRINNIKVRTPGVLNLADQNVNYSNFYMPYGDVDGNGYVNSDDQGQVLAYDQSDKICDLNLDGMVNVDDLNIVSNDRNYNAGPNKKDKTLFEYLENL